MAIGTPAHEAFRKGYFQEMEGGKIAKTAILRQERGIYAIGEQNQGHSCPRQRPRAHMWCEKIAVSYGIKPEAVPNGYVCVLRLCAKPSIY